MAQVRIEMSPLKISKLPGILELEDRALLYNEDDMFYWQAMETCRKIFGGFVAFEDDNAASRYGRLAKATSPDDVKKLIHDPDVGLVNLNATIPGYVTTFPKGVTLLDPESRNFKFFGREKLWLSWLTSVSVDARSENGQQLRCMNVIGLTVECAMRGLYECKRPDMAAVSIERFGAGLERDRQIWKPHQEDRPRSASGAKAAAEALFKK